MIENPEPDVQRQPIEPMAWGRPGSMLWQLQATGLLKVRTFREVEEDTNRLLRLRGQDGVSGWDGGVPFFPRGQFRP